MTQRNECVDLVINELERYGLRGEVAERGKHLEVAWSTPHGRRFVIVAKTPSDWRASLNTRSDLRKMLRADNLQPKQISELSFQKAMSLPKPVMLTEHILQKDVNELTDLIFDLQSQITQLREKLDTATINATIKFGSQPKDSDDVVLEIPTKLYNASEKPKYRTKLDLLLSLLLTQFRPVTEIIKESGLTRGHVNNLLQKAKNRGLAENGLRGEWSRKS